MKTYVPIDPENTKRIADLMQKTHSNKIGMLNKKINDLTTFEGDSSTRNVNLNVMIKKDALLMVSGGAWEVDKKFREEMRERVFDGVVEKIQNMRIFRYFRGDYSELRRNVYQDITANYVSLNKSTIPTENIYVSLTRKELSNYRDAQLRYEEIKEEFPEENIKKPELEKREYLDEETGEMVEEKKIPFVRKLRDDELRFDWESLVSFDLMIVDRIPSEIGSLKYIDTREPAIAGEDEFEDYVFKSINSVAEEAENLAREKVIDVIENFHAYDKTGSFFDGFGHMMMCVRSELYYCEPEDFLEGGVHELNSSNTEENWPNFREFAVSFLREFENAIVNEVSPTICDEVYNRIYSRRDTEIKRALFPGVIEYFDSSEEKTEEDLAQEKNDHIAEINNTLNTLIPEAIRECVESEIRKNVSSLTSFFIEEYNAMLRAQYKLLKEHLLANINGVFCEETELNDNENASLNPLENNETEPPSSASWQERIADSVTIGSRVIQKIGDLFDSGIDNINEAGEPQVTPRNNNGLIESTESLNQLKELLKNTTSQKTNEILNDNSDTTVYRKTSPSEKQNSQETGGLLRNAKRNVMLKVATPSVSNSASNNNSWSSAKNNSGSSVENRKNPAKPKPESNKPTPENYDNTPPQPPTPANDPRRDKCQELVFWEKDGYYVLLRDGIGNYLLLDEEKEVVRIQHVSGSYIQFQGSNIIIQAAGKVLINCCSAQYIKKI